MARRPIVAIDGPAASGKSTTARAVARELGFCHLDSGALYRAVALVALEGLGASERWDADRIVAAARARGISARPAGERVEVAIGGAPVDEALRTEPVTRASSRVAVLPPVREFVNGLLRVAAGAGGVVVDGRDIGTVVFPDAEVKVFLVADAAERAKRRLLEGGRAADAGAVQGEAEALLARDARDAGREVAPLRPAPDAVLLDTTALTFAEQVRRVVALVRAREGGASLDRPPRGG